MKITETLQTLSTGESVFLTPTIELRKYANAVGVYRYYSLNNNPRGFSICAVEDITDADWQDEKVMKRVIRSLKQRIADERKTIMPLYGMTYYCN